MQESHCGDFKQTMICKPVIQQQIHESALRSHVSACAVLAAKSNSSPFEGFVTLVNTLSAFREIGDVRLIMKGSLRKII